MSAVSAARARPISASGRSRKGIRGTRVGRAAAATRRLATRRPTALLERCAAWPPRFRERSPSPAGTRHARAAASSTRRSASSTQSARAVAARCGTAARTTSSRPVKIPRRRSIPPLAPRCSVPSTTPAKVEIVSDTPNPTRGVRLRVDKLIELKGQRAASIPTGLAVRQAASSHSMRRGRARGGTLSCLDAQATDVPAEVPTKTRPVTIVTLPTHLSTRAADHCARRHERSICHSHGKPHERAM
jgi:hypothetical protein